jgi:hypothetical protein
MTDFPRSTALRRLLYCRLVALVTSGKVDVVPTAEQIAHAVNVAISGASPTALGFLARIDRETAKAWHFERHPRLRSCPKDNGHTQMTRPSFLTDGDDMLHDIERIDAAIRTGLTLDVLATPEGYCSTPAEVRVEMPIEFVVYVDRAHLVDSCRYHEVMAHEQRHVENSLAWRRVYQGRITVALKRELVARTAPALSMKADLHCYWTEVIKRLVTEQQERMNTEIADGDAVIDSGESKAATFSACPGTW